ncbi:MAG: hypothetical protein HYZ01_07070 [Ignavibacteriales bacterium]|nr:hypothetical protein [Ignavibacteriales bacterium]
MKRILRRSNLMMVVLLLALPYGAMAQSDIGLGIYLGNPTGMTLKFGSPPSTSVDLLAAWRLDDTFFAQGQYNFTITTLTQTKEGTVYLYGGPGIFLRSSSRQSDMMGFSGNFGIDWIVTRHLELFTEISPKIGLIRSTELEITGGIGFRYLF